MKRSIAVITALAATIATAYAQNVQEALAAAAEALIEAQEEAIPAPKPTFWERTFLGKLDFGQTSFSNWAAGGNNTVTQSAYIDANANYQKDKLMWTNRLQLDYGIMYSSDKPIMQKTGDRIYLESKLGYVAAKNLNYTAALDFKTQFDQNYNYSTPSAELLEQYPTATAWRRARSVKSAFFSPAYINLGLGMDWVPSDWLTVNFAPLTGGIVVVDDARLRKSYGMEPDEFGVYPSVRFEFGARLKTDAKVNINDNIKYTTQLVLFSDYLHKPGNFRVNWDNMLFWQIAKYFSMTITTGLIYDDRVRVGADEAHPDGFRKVQFKEQIAFGFAYTISRPRS